MKMRRSRSLCSGRHTPPAAYSGNNALTNLGASGYRDNASGGLTNIGSNGNYWTYSSNSQTNARNLNFNSSNVNPLNNNNRANGFSVRPCQAFKKDALFLFQWP